MNKLIKTFIISSAALCLIGCAKEIAGQGGNEPGGNGNVKGNGSCVSFSIGNDAAATKAGTGCQEKQCASYKFFNEGDEAELIMVETVSSIDGTMMSYAEPATKGVLAYTENFDKLYGTSLYATAYDGAITSGKLTDVWGSYLENGGTVNFRNIGDNTYSYDYSKGKATNLRWPDSKKLRYFIQAPYSVTKDLKPDFYGDGSIKFSYADPNIPVDGVIKNGSVNQTDFLFSNKVIDQPATPGDGVSANILMYHSLTAVKFKVGTPDEGNMPIITKVTLKGIKSKGDCTIAPNYTDSNTSAGGNKSNKDSTPGTSSQECTSWSSLDADVNYVEEFSGTTNYDGAGFAESFYSKETYKNNLGTDDGSKILLLIPQKNTAVEAEVEFKVTESGETYKRTAKLNIDWKAGDIHTYTFTINKVDVSVIDEVKGIEKTNVVTANTGNVTSYLRATYVLAWYYGSSVVAPYVGDANVVLGEGWKKIGDYYYYKYPVAPQKSSKAPVFAGWTAPSVNNSGFPLAHLEMMILLQGVQYDTQKSKVTSAWGSEVATYLSTDIEE